MNRREFLGVAGIACAASASSGGCAVLRDDNALSRTELMDRPYILHDDATIPVVGWGSPNRDQIRPDVMRLAAEAGFNVTMSEPSPGKVIEALDIAHEAGVRLILKAGMDLGRMSFEQGRGYQLTGAHKKHIRSAVTEVKDHAGLYGYYICDEPYYADYDWIAGTIREIESLDTYHMCYVNHWPPNIQGGFGAGSQEALWKEWIKKTNPRFLSYDSYPIRRKPPEITHEWDPYVFGDVVVSENYFAELDFARSFSSLLELPLWAFTFSSGDAEGMWPIQTEGYIRFQLMCDLAYGARGLQYFKFMRNNAVIRKDGTPTPTWHIAKKVNADVHTLWRKMKHFRSIGVHHTGPIWPGTTLPMRTTDNVPWMDLKGPQFKCEGDPAVLGVFDDPEGNAYVLAVNKNPVDRARIRMLPDADDGLEHEWTALAPGEGKLFALQEKAPPVLQAL